MMCVLVLTSIWAHNRRFITLEEIEDFEPFLFIGLPAVTLFHLIMRSMRVEGLLLESGIQVVESNCPSNFLAMYGLLMETKVQLKNLGEESLSDHESLWVQKFLLYAGCDTASRNTNIDTTLVVSRQDQLRRSFSFLNAVATQVTQQKHYKSNFSDILVGVAAEIGNSFER
jgi:hypothetical protein